MNQVNKFALSMVLIAVLGLGLVGCGGGSGGNNSTVSAKPLKPASLAISDYVGWGPYYHAQVAGILKKWGDRYGYDIKVHRMTYGNSLNAFAAGQVDACVMTNMDMLNVPAAGGLESSAIIMGDYSNGNDAILARNGVTIATLKGQRVGVLVGSVSDYVLARCSEQNGLKSNDVVRVGMDENAIGTAFNTNADLNVCVTWNPYANRIAKNKSVSTLFDSSKIPGEIQDLTVIRTAKLKSDPDFARALVGAWYEEMGLLTAGGETTQQVVAVITKELSLGNPSDFTETISTTRYFYTPQEALKFNASPDLKVAQEKVRKFSFENKFMGSVQTADEVGIEYPDGEIRGSKTNVKFHYDDTFMKEAAAGKITLN